MTFAYDALGRVASMSDSARTYSYDSTGKVGTMTAYADQARTIPAYSASYSYDAGARATTLTDLVGSPGTQLHKYTYTYDQAGNVLSLADAALAGTTSTSYTYDDLKQLTKVTDSSGTTSFTYDANHNRTQMVALVAGTSYTTRYTYDIQADTELLSKTDPNGKVTAYVYDAAGNLASSTYDPTTINPAGVNQTTSYTYDTRGRLTTVTEPSGTTVAFTYDADGNRASKTVTTGGPTPTTTTVRDLYQAGRIAYQTDGNGTTLATFTYDSNGVPASVQVGSDPTTAPRYYFVYNRHGDVVALVDASGNTVATYSYDVFGGVTASETLPGGWSNPYRYDGKDRVRYDSETSLYWMSVRAYDPTLGRFLSRDPLKRSPLVFTGQPYVYAGNNPLKNVDPSGQWFYAGEGSSGATSTSGSSSVQTTSGSNGGSSGGSGGTGGGPLAVPTQYACVNTCLAKRYADGGATIFGWIAGAAAILSGAAAIYFTTITAGFGVFLAAGIAGAGLSIGFSAGLAAIQFSTFDQDLGRNPAYLTQFRQNITDAIHFSADLGLAMQALVQKPLATLLDGGKAFIAAVRAGTITADMLKASSFGAGLLIGALASLLVLPYVADLYLNPLEQLETGAFQDCGNNTFRIEDGMLCPALFY